MVVRPKGMRSAPIGGFAPSVPHSEKSLSHVQLFATPWTIQSMDFSRPEYWGGLLFLSPGDLPNPGIEPRSHALQADSSPAEPPGRPLLQGRVWTVEIHKDHPEEKQQRLFVQCLL